MEAVSDILVTRAHQPAGLRRMVMASLVIHAVVGTAVLFMPSFSADSKQPDTVMTISLGGAPGPRAGGMTSMGGQAVQAQRPPELKRVPVEPPAAKAPEMALPAPKVKPSPPKPIVQQAPPEARSKTPVFGEEPKKGNTMAPTGATGVGFGLTTGGAGATGYLDVANFCCPEYLSGMLQLIQRNWNGRQDVLGQTQIRFTIMRDGRISDVSVEKPSGYFALDQAAERALLVTRQLPPLPSQYTETQLTVHLVFRYER
jgi:TonB family protein